MTANEIMRHIDNRIHELGLTYTALSTQCIVSKDELYFWKCGLHLRQLKTVIRLADALGLELVVCKKNGVKQDEA